jgi:hypothetical protein
MITAELETVVSTAVQANAAGKLWHFHILSPTCCFNKQRDRYALVVEIPSDRQTFVAYSANRPAEEGKQLVALLHGKEVLEGTGSATQITHEITATIISRARDLNSRGIAWHHHMLFPECALNPNPGKWTLLFEDPESGEKIRATYNSEPLSDLKEVEALFYTQQK